MKELTAWLQGQLADSEKLHTLSSWQRVAIMTIAT